MFIGHFGLAFGAKAAAPRVSLGVLFAAAGALDLLWPVLLLAGAETVRVAPGDTPVAPLEFVSYPWSHSLLLVLVWSAIAGAVAWRLGRGAAAVVAALVASHWVLDFVTHRPDLPLWPGGPKAGLGLWYSVPGTLAVESLLFAAGVAVYARVTRPVRRGGTAVFAALVVFLAATHLANLFGPPPPSAEAVARASLALWLLPLWAWDADRRREVRPSAAHAARATPA